MVCPRLVVLLAWTEYQEESSLSSRNVSLLNEHCSLSQMSSQTGLCRGSCDHWLTQSQGIFVDSLPRSHPTCTVSWAGHYFLNRSLICLSCSLPLPELYFVNQRGPEQDWMPWLTPFVVLALTARKWHQQWCRCVASSFRSSEFERKFGWALHIRCLGWRSQFKSALKGTEVHQLSRF